MPNDEIALEKLNPFFQNCFLFFDLEVLRSLCKKMKNNNEKLNRRIDENNIIEIQKINIFKWWGKVLNQTQKY